MIQLIKRQCSSAVNDYIASDALLFRGVKGIGPTHHVSLQPITQYCALDYQSIDNVFNKHLKKRGCLQRLNVSYASSKKTTAERYGDCFYFFLLMGLGIHLPAMFLICMLILNYG